MEGWREGDKTIDAGRTLGLLGLGCTEGFPARNKTADLVDFAVKAVLPRALDIPFIPPCSGT